MRVAVALAWSTVAALGVSAACDRRHVYQPPAASYTAAALELADSGSARPPERVRGAAVAPAFFVADSLATRPLLGRLFLREDYRPGAGAVVVLGHRLWQRRFGARPQVIGTSVLVDGRRAVVVGVMPPEFDVPPGTDAWIPRAGPDTAAASARQPR